MLAMAVLDFDGQLRPTRKFARMMHKEHLVECALGHGGRDNKLTDQSFLKYLVIGQERVRQQDENS